MMYYIKCRDKGQKTFRFIDSKGYTTRLKIHAARFSEENVDQVLTWAREDPDNAKTEFIKVAIS